MKSDNFVFPYSIKSSKKTLIWFRVFFFKKKLYVLIGKNCNKSVIENHLLCYSFTNDTQKQKKIDCKSFTYD